MCSWFTLLGVRIQVDRNIFLFSDSMLNHRIERVCLDINSFCRGVSAGADQVIMKYEKKCLDDNTDECTDLGNAASQGEKSKQIVIL